MREILIAGALATTLLANTACGAEPNRAPDPVLQREFEATQQYWTNRGFTVGKNAVRIVQIRGNDEFRCPEGGISSSYVHSYNSSGYCPETKTIMLTDLPNRFAVRHEYGHAIARDPLALVDTNSELGADCLAGMSDPEMPAAEVQGYIMKLGDDVSSQRSSTDGLPHGTAQERIDAFTKGQESKGDFLACLGLKPTIN
jgi:hypothetical protein